MRSLAPKSSPQRQGSPHATVAEAKATQARPPHIFQRLQQTAGNQAVLRILGVGAPGSAGRDASRPASPIRSDPPALPLWGAWLQTKLKVNPPGDAYEQGADRVADQVMRMPESGASTLPSISHRQTGSAVVQRSPDKQKSDAEKLREFKKSRDW